jgi:hypothetical protein
MAEKKECAICGREATQVHHLSYDPPIIINVCVPCHMKVHQHGVGRGKGEEPITEQFEEEPKLLMPFYTKEKEIDGTPYITSKDDEVLKLLVCPNCGIGKGLDWQIFGD